MANDWLRADLFWLFKLHRSRVVKNVDCHVLLFLISNKMNIGYPSCLSKWINTRKWFHIFSIEWCMQVWPVWLKAFSFCLPSPYWPLHLPWKYRGTYAWKIFPEICNNNDIEKNNVYLDYNLKKIIEICRIEIITSYICSEISIISSTSGNLLP